MFEKEAEKYAIENWEHYEEGQNDSKELKQAYLAGAEFGYNKCNEQLTKAKETIEGLMRFCRCFAQHHTEDIRYKEAEHFLRERE